MERVRLGDICKIISGSTPKTNIAEYWDGDINWITPVELSDETYVIEESQRKITLRGVQKTGLKSFPKGTVILSSRAPIGKVGIAGKEMYCNQGFKNLICSEKIDNQYLYWYLKGKANYLNSLGRGATFKEISKSIVENIEIPLPNLEVQSFVASVLKQCWDLMLMQKKNIKSFDTLIKSRFVEMFGDPIINNKELPTLQMKEVIYLKAGITTEANEIHEQSVKYNIPCYGGNGIRGYVKEATQNGNHPVIGRQGALCGNVQMATGEFHATEHAILVTPLVEMNVIWLYHLLRYMDLYRYHTGAAQPGLSVKTLNTVDIPIASLISQNSFAFFVSQIDKLKFV